MYDSLLVKLTCSTFLVLCGFICRLRFKGFWNALRFVWISSYGYIYRIQGFPVASFWGHHCQCSLDNQMTLDCTLKGEWNFGYMPRVYPYVALIWHSLCVPQEWCVREPVCPTRMVRVPLCSQVHTDLKGSIRILCLSSWLFTGSSSSSHRNIPVHQKWGWFQGGGNVESANFLNICKMELLNFRAYHSYEISWINPI